MKVLFMTRTLSGRGGQIVLTSLIRELRRQGVDCHFVAFKPQGAPSPADELAIYEGLQLELIDIPVRQDAPAQMNEYIDAAVRYLQKNQQAYDRVILDSWYIALAGIVAHVDTDKTFHFVQSNPEFTPADSSALWEARLFSMLPLYPMRRIVVSKSLQEHLLLRYQQSSERINLYIDDAYRQASFSVVKHTPLRLISSASDFTIPSKGLDTLIDSVNKLTEPCTLTLVSGVPLKQPRHSRVPVKVVSARTPQEMIKLMQQHDVYVNTSRNETFCLALAEALTLGMPTVALDSVGNRDYAHGDNFIFAEDTEQLQAGLERLFALPLRRQLHDASRNSMRQYTLDVMVQQFRQLTAI